MEKTFKMFAAIYNGSKIYEYKNGEKAIFIDNEKTIIENYDELKNIARSFRSDMSEIRILDNTTVFPSNRIRTTEDENLEIFNIIKKYFEIGLSGNLNFHDDFQNEINPIFEIASIRTKKEKEAYKIESARLADIRDEKDRADREAKKAAKEAAIAEKEAAKEAKRLAKLNK